MTTIACDGKSMAGDSLVTAGNERVGFHKKVTKLPDGRILGCCGDTIQIVQFTNYLLNGATDDRPSLEGDDFCALLLNPDGTIDYMSKEFVPVRYFAPMTIGSGGSFALGAMLAGKSPAEAVEIAIERDIRTGGEVVSISLGED